jgi:tetratricopeptide (TPR) repeat protein
MILIAVTLASLRLLQAATVLPDQANTQTTREASASSAVVQGATASAQTEITDRRLRAVEDKQNQLDGELKNIDRIAMVLGALVGIGALASLIGFVRSEVRATEAHRFALATSKDAEARSITAFNLAIKGETASQARAAEVHESFLAGSRQTLDLVNATLTLSKDASERAAHSQEERLAESLTSLDSEAQDLLSHIREIDSRTLLRDQTLLERLKTLADGLSNYEASRIYLPRVPLLSPACQFARGMQFHVTQQFSEALKCWRSVVHDRDAEPHYRALALYWTGYEQQSLGQFDEAANSYANAEILVGDVPRFELKRLALEMQFFSDEDGDLHAVVKGLETLLVDMEAHRHSEELIRRIARTRLTLGNVLHVFAESEATKGNQDEAIQRFRAAIVQFQGAAQLEQYARSGLAEALWEVGSHPESIQLYTSRVREDMRQEALKRPEPRTKVLALTIELIACMRVSAWNEEVPLLQRDVIRELGDVNERLWVYSAIRRKPLSKKEFRRELEQYVRAWAPMSQPS